MVLNLWKNTIPCCTHHLPERKEMILSSGKTLSYKCPECDNEISVNDFEKILNAISKICVNRSISAEWGAITGEKFVIKKTIKCEILDHTEDEKYYVSIDNIKAGKRP